MSFKSLLIPALLTAGILAGCGDSSNNNGVPAEDNLSLGMQLPDSLTGGSDVNSPRNIANKIAGVALAGKGGTGEPCSFMGLKIRMTHSETVTKHPVS